MKKETKELLTRLKTFIKEYGDYVVKDKETLKVLEELCRIKVTKKFNKKYGTNISIEFFMNYDSKRNYDFNISYVSKLDVEIIEDIQALEEPKPKEICNDDEINDLLNAKAGVYGIDYELAKKIYYEHNDEVTIESGVYEKMMECESKKNEHICVYLIVNSEFKMLSLSPTIDI